MLKCVRIVRHRYGLNVCVSKPTSSWRAAAVKIFFFFDYLGCIVACLSVVFLMFSMFLKKILVAKEGSDALR